MYHIIIVLLPDALAAYLITMGAVLEKKAIRQRVRTHLQSVGNNSDLLGDEETLIRLYKQVKGTTYDFAAVVVSGVSVILAISQIAGLTIVLLAVGVFSVLAVHIHLMWAGSDLDRVDRCSNYQRHIAIAALFVSVALKIFIGATGKS